MIGWKGRGCVQSTARAHKDAYRRRISNVCYTEALERNFMDAGDGVACAFPLYPHF